MIFDEIVFYSKKANTTILFNRQVRIIHQQNTDLILYNITFIVDLVVLAVELFFELTVELI